MVFSSPVFLFAFLPLVLLGIAVLRPRRAQAIYLLSLSIVFYIWGAGAAVLVLCVVTTLAWLSGRLPWRAWSESGRRRKSRAAITTAIFVLLCPLLFFKYLPPLAAATGSGLLAGVVIPLGISFFTFHAISYVVDVRGGKVEAEPNFRDFALYLFVFPHQIAGPIVRYAEIREELKGARESTLRQFGYGVTRFSWGLAKKVLVADQLGGVAGPIFGLNESGVQLSLATAWIGAVCYAFQIYFDFSGYSDMAIGLAIMLGFHFPENFSQPYRSISVTDFWRRWHLTLSRWFRDYVYFPLGGNRRGVAREYGALLTVFLLTSLWHGGTVNFLIWGGLHSLGLVTERVTGLRNSERLAGARRSLMFVFLVVSWVPFRTATTADLWHYWASMVGTTDIRPQPVVLTSVTPLVWCALVLAIITLFGRRTDTGFGVVFGTRSSRDLERFRFKVAVPATAVLLVVSAFVVLWSDFSPFLYFQF